VRQVPQGAESASPADQALYDAMATALLGEHSKGQPAEAGDEAPLQQQLRRMLHYLVGTQLRKHLERYAAYHLEARIPDFRRVLRGGSTLCLMGALLSQQIVCAMQLQSADRMESSNLLISLQQAFSVLCLCMKRCSMGWASTRSATPLTCCTM